MVRDARTSNDDLAEGSRVGDYEVVGRIGDGGFSVVYEALHRTIGKRVAIKVLDAVLSRDQAMVDRFLGEARAVNQIRHRHIVDIFDFGTLDDGRHYYVMELLDGRTLAELLADYRQFSPPEVVRLLKGVARALDAAHEHGVIHRDLKPENVMVSFDEEGVPFTKLLDFGIAKLVQAGSLRDTRPGKVVGTPLYMSPEQCRGERVDARTDVYAFGVLVYRLLTGVSPFTGETMKELVQNQLEQDVPRPSTIVEGIAPELDEPVARMLARRAADRHASAGEALDDFARAARDAGFDVEIGPPAIRVSVRPEPTAHSGIGTQPTLVGTSGALRSSRPAPANDRSLALVALVAAALGGAAVMTVLLVAPPLRERLPAASASAEKSVARSLSAPTQATPGPCGTGARPAACSHPLAIDDFEDGDGQICPRNGRNGHWIGVHDGTGTLSVPRGPLQRVTQIPGCRGMSAWALHVAGSGLRDWGGGVAIELSDVPGQVFDVRPHAGIRFWARATEPLPLDVAVATRGTLDVTYGGGCKPPPDGQCNDHFVARREVGPEWAPYSITFEELAQRGWGVVAEKDLASVAELHFLVHRSPEQREVAFDLWIDDVTYFDRAESP